MLRILVDEGVNPGEAVHRSDTQELKLFRVKTPAGNYRIVACDTAGEAKLYDELVALDQEHAPKKP